MTITQGQILWVVWSPFASAQASSEGRLGTGTQPYRASTNGGQTWTGPFQDIRWKFRIWCSTPVGHYEAFGDLTCRGSNR